MKTKAIFSTAALWRYLKKHDFGLSSTDYVTVFCKKKRFGFAQSDSVLDVECNGEFEIQYESKVFIRLFKVLQELPESPITITFDERSSSLGIEAIAG